MLTLLRHADSNSCECFPGLDRLARMTGLDRGTVKRCLARLTQAGIIRTIQQGGGSGHSTRRELVLTVNGGAGAPLRHTKTGARAHANGRAKVLLTGAQAPPEGPMQKGPRNGPPQAAGGRFTSRSQVESSEVDRICDLLREEFGVERDMQLLVADLLEREPDSPDALLEYLRSRRDDGKIDLPRIAVWAFRNPQAAFDSMIDPPSASRPVRRDQPDAPPIRRRLKTRSHVKAGGFAEVWRVSGDGDRQSFIRKSTGETLWPDQFEEHAGDGRVKLNGQTIDLSKALKRGEITHGAELKLERR